MKILEVIQTAVVMSALALSAHAGETGKEKTAREADDDTVQTPFGPAKRAKPRPAPTAAQRAAKPLVKVEEDGDTFTFTRQTPFGTQTWKRERADLSAAEKQLIEESAPEAGKASSDSKGDGGGEKSTDAATSGDEPEQ